MSEQHTRRPVHNWSRRVQSLSLAATYFGWVWVTLTALWELIYDPTYSTTTEWWAIEGESLVYAAAFLVPVALVFPLSIGLLLSPRRWMSLLAMILCAVQVLLLIGVVAPHAGFVYEIVALALTVGIAVVCMVVGMKSAVGGVYGSEHGAKSETP